MGSRLATPPSSTSSSTTAVNRAGASNPSANANQTRTHSNSTSQSYQQQQQPAHHRRRSSSNHHNSHGLFGQATANNTRRRTTSTNLDPLAPTAFNLNLLRYVGLESDDQSSDDDSPRTNRRLQHFIITLRDVPCPVCHKTVPGDSFDKHILQCLSKPRIDYNEDTLTEDKGECVICLDDLVDGQKIARLPCLCIYHKSCIDNWFRINRSCPEHPGD